MKRLLVAPVAHRLFPSLTNVLRLPCWAVIGLISCSLTSTWPCRGNHLPVLSCLQEKNHVKGQSTDQWPLVWAAQSSQMHINELSPLDKSQNILTDMLPSPAAFDSIAQTTMTWMNENIHRHVTIIFIIEISKQGWFHKWIQNFYFICLMYFINCCCHVLLSFSLLGKWQN